MKKRNSQIQLIALDMDGTLLNDAGEISPFTQKIITEAREKNIHVVLSTGRPVHLCHPFAKKLNATSYMITANGAEIWAEDKKLLERHVLPAQTAESLWYFGNRHNIHMWMIAAGEVFRNSARPETFSDYEWLKFGYGSLDDKTHEIVAQHLAKYEGLEITNSKVTNVEINKEGVNKAAALHIICQKLDITMNEVMAMGDSLNDLKMLEQAGIGVAVANAQNIIKEVADYTTDTNNNDGVAKAIERFIL